MPARKKPKKARPEATLNRYRDQWRTSGRNAVLARALRFCLVRRWPEPPWLHRAIYGLGRKLVLEIQKTGRSSDVLKDDELYATFRACLEAGLSKENAYHHTAEIHGLRTKKGEYADFTVRSAVLRHQKRIVPELTSPPGWENYDRPWEIKEAALAADRKVQALRREIEEANSKQRTKN
jgi:hypothetical protein